MRRRVPRSFSILLAAALPVVLAATSSCGASAARAADAPRAAETATAVVIQRTAIDDPHQWRRERQWLLERRVVFQMRSDGKVAPPAALAKLDEPGYGQLLYMPDWETEDNGAAFRVLTGEKFEQRLSPADVERIGALFPEARLRTFAQAYGPTGSPCYAVGNLCRGGALGGPQIVRRPEPPQAK